MGLSYSRAFFAVAFGVLVWISLRPSPRLEGALDWVLLPTRVLAELTAPVRWLSLAEVRAAEKSLLGLQELEHAASKALHAAERRMALPTEPGLLAGRVFVHAQAIARVDGKLDRLLVQLQPGAGAFVQQGMPVVHGDIYVGRVACVQPDRDQAAIDLVTGRDFFVGARLDVPGGARPVRMVVGGLTQGGDDYALALHNPETSQGLAGTVRVEEGQGSTEPWAREAQDFVLGQLRGSADEGYWVLPELDYLHGLFRVAIVCSDGDGAPASQEGLDVLEDSKWTAARVLGSGAPSDWREGIGIDAGAWKGVQEGAAVVFAARLIGRVQHAGKLSARVSLLGDRGFRVPVLARVSGEDAPRVLGRLVSLGRDPSDGAVLLRWKPVPPIGLDEAGPEALPALLFTGAGALGVPRGLALGDTTLPRGPGPHVLRVMQSVDTRRLDHLWVRQIQEAPEDCP